MTKKNKLNELISKVVPIRMWAQLTFLLVWLDPFGWRYHSMCAPVFHCYSCPLATLACPIGVLANFSALHMFPFIAIGLLVLTGILLGTIICGWFCPFGLLQDITAKTPTPKFNLPKWTANFRYVVLIGTVFAVPYFFGENHSLFICRFCPAGGIEAAVPNMTKQAISGQSVVWPNTLKLTILTAFLISIFFVKRPWCRLLCPLGAIFSLFNHFSAFFLRVASDKCTDCKQCQKLCQYGIEPEKSPNDIRCIRCLECTKCGQGVITLGTIFEHCGKS